MNLLKYILPGFYFFNTRLQSKIRLLSFVFIYIIPTFYLYSLSIKHITIIDIFNYLLSIITLYTVYEIGYIENDTIRDSVEPSNTKRLNTEDELYISDNKTKIYIIRFIIFLVLMCFHPLPNLLIQASIAILLCYYIYNNITSIRLRLPLHFLLVSIRYYFPYYVCFGFNVNVFIFSILLFPLHNTLERCREDKFNFPSSIKNFVMFNTTTGRVIYYLILSITFFLLDKLGFSVAFMTYAFLYFMIYRVMCVAFELFLKWHRNNIKY